jgi:hypothetical protein
MDAIKHLWWVALLHSANASHALGPRDARFTVLRLPKRGREPRHGVWGRAVAGCSQLVNVAPSETPSGARSAPTAPSPSAIRLI